ncbi:uncharacterized protein C6orf47 homolog [Protopterus annectens]|uniref:uncharacterized protein C6orf47 homolog n=1 Tax=Protopterus annectens TaxID=7888 RepID=UPI001CF96F81|nr:uncharacterized protein C6orf47 homolog [Protopterus annectens]
MLLRETFNWLTSLPMPLGWRKKKKELDFHEGEDEEEKVVEAKPVEQRYWFSWLSHILGGRDQHPNTGCLEAVGEQKTRWFSLWRGSSSQTVDTGEPELKRAHWLSLWNHSNQPVDVGELEQKQTHWRSLWSSSNSHAGGDHNPGTNNEGTEKQLLQGTLAGLDVNSPEYFEICFNFIRHVFDLFVVGFLSVCSPFFRILLDIISIQGVLKLWLHGIAMFLVATFGMGLVLWVVQTYILQFACLFGLLQVMVLWVSLRNQMEMTVEGGEEEQQQNDPPSSEKEPSDFNVK